jgi:hypothetical protein
MLGMIVGACVLLLSATVGSRHDQMSCPFRGDEIMTRAKKRTRGANSIVVRVAGKDPIIRITRSRQQHRLARPKRRKNTKIPNGDVPKLPFPQIQIA